MKNNVMVMDRSKIIQNFGNVKKSSFLRNYFVFHMITGNKLNNSGASLDEVMSQNYTKLDTFRSSIYG